MSEAVINPAETQEAAPAAAQPYVLFPLGKKRFALPAGKVSELARPDRLQRFPHATALLAGVLVRRGHIVPVLDVAQVLVGPNAPTRKFYLIATREFSGASEWTAIPVTGECELASAASVPTSGNAPYYVSGWLTLKEEIIEVVDLEKLAAGERAP
jgi:chemotaxis signal transduction protein